MTELKIKLSPDAMDSLNCFTAASKCGSKAEALDLILTLAFTIQAAKKRGVPVEINGVDITEVFDALIRDEENGRSYLGPRSEKIDSILAAFGAPRI